MWKTVLNNINQLILSNWKSVFFLVLGIVLGSALWSCSVVAPAWEGVEDGTSTVVETGEEVIVDVYTGAKDLIIGGVDAVEGVVEGGYNLVTDPFTSDEE